MKSLLVVLLACDAGAPMPPPVAPGPVAAEPSPPPPPAAVTAPLPFVTANGHTYAIVQVHSVLPELCTNMGGTDWAFSVEGMPPEYQLHGGGHGIFGRGTTLPSVQQELGDDDHWRYDYYVADVLIPSHRFARRVLCPKKELMFDGSVVSVIPARDLEDARAKLAAAARDGLHGAVRIDTFDR